MAGIRNEHGLTGMQEQYCLEYIQCNNATAAYRAVYDCSNSLPVTVNENASRLHANPLVTARIEALRAPVIAEVLKKYQHTLEGVLDELEEARTKALSAPTPQTAAAISAIMAKAKLLGLVPDNAVVTANVSIASLIREMDTQEAACNLTD